MEFRTYLMQRMSLADKMQAIVGDAYLSFAPQSGKPQNIPSMNNGQVTKEIRGEKLGALKSMTVEEHPYGDTKLTAILQHALDELAG